MHVCFTALQEFAFWKFPPKKRKTKKENVHATNNHGLRLINFKTTVLKTRRGHFAAPNMLA